ncbi:MAG: peptidoglycan editing factor PgeF [Wujia sp.]
MERKKFPINISEDGLLSRLEKNISYVSENRSTYLTYCKGEDERGRFIVPVIKYQIFDGHKDLIHGFSTRFGGVSKEHLSSLNLSFTRGDDRENVLCNHERFAKALGYRTDSLVFSDQIHETTIYKATKADCGKGIKVDTDILGVDGLVTNEPGVTLITFFADCVPNFFYDPVKNVVGLAHSGWRGTVAHIGTRMIEVMVNEYGSVPEDIICAIGPSICKSCYEVSQDVIDEFRKEYAEDVFSSLAVSKDDGKYLLDLQLACRYNLLLAGVCEENIAMPDICTCCNPTLLFSHRASKGMRGNLAAVIGFK